MGFGDFSNCLVHSCEQSRASDGSMNFWHGICAPQTTRLVWSLLSTFDSLHIAIIGDEGLAPSSSSHDVFIFLLFSFRNSHRCLPFANFSHALSCCKANDSSSTLSRHLVIFFSFFSSLSTLFALRNKCSFFSVSHYNSTIRCNRAVLLLPRGMLRACCPA